MTSLALVTNLGFSAGGLIVGYVLGRVAPRPAQPHSCDMSTPDTAGAHRHSRIVKSTAIVLFVLGVITTAVAAYTSVQRYSDSEVFRTTAECQARWNQAFRQVIVERNKATDQERAAQRVLLGTVLDPAATADARRQAVTGYYNVLREVDTTRADNPLPASDRC